MAAIDDTVARIGGSRLYLVLTRRLCRRPPLETVRAAIEGGCGVVQIREPAMAAGALVAWVRDVRRVTAELGVVLIVNDRPDVAVIADADGVHLGQDDLDPADVRETVGRDLVIGFSTHSREQVERAAAAPVHYLGLGPVFDTATKGLPGRGLGLVREALPHARIPAFLIGGVSIENVRALAAAGARRIAVSRAICEASDPRATAAALCAALGEPA
jgi:thiamine-phosphate pyrophosphorylase